MYTIIFSEDAKKDLKALSKKAPQALPKLSKLLEEIKVHPRTGTGQVEALKGYDGNVYSRRITKEHRIVYAIFDEVIEFIKDVGTNVGINVGTAEIIVIFAVA